MNKLMKLLEKENFLVLPGGSDIDPRIYGKENYKSYVSDYSLRKDIKEMALYKDAIDRKQPVFGICRGMQLAAALNDLTLIQDIDHPASHNIQLIGLDNSLSERAQVNSIHHQLVWTENKLETENFKVYGYCKLSKHHDYQKDEPVDCIIEPEIIYFPKTNTLGVQFHPEMMSHGTTYNKIIDYLYDFVKTKML